jgi:hypothetical protein
MRENKMGNRGSKSILTVLILAVLIVKEQRVDGSWCINKNSSYKHLRYTLMGCENSYQVGIPSKLLEKRTYSTISKNLTLNPHFITGFTCSASRR